MKPTARINILNPLANDYDPDNNPLTITSISPPNGGRATIINSGTAISYTPPAGVRSYCVNGVNYPADGFCYEISNGRGGTCSGVISIIINASDVPQIRITNPPPPYPYATNAGAIVPLIASITPWQNIVKVDFYHGHDRIGEVTNGNNGSFTLNWPAAYDINDYGITAQVTDKYGQINTSQPIQINVNTNGLSGTLVAALDSMVGSSGTNLLTTTNLATIRDGFFNLYGRAVHSLGSNVVWQLGVYSMDGTLLRSLTNGASAVGSVNASSLLASCDLTTLENDVYDLRITVSGGCQMASMDVQFRLESNLKLGQFSFGQQDLIIPVSGVPLTVARTYNSINPNRGDFGYGWTYALSDMDVSLDETRENVPDLDDALFSQRSGGSWDVTLTLPNGQRTTFYFFLDPVNYAKWQAAPGVTAKLESLGDYKLQTLIGSVVGDPDLYYWDASPGTPINVFDFPGFVLTTQDGTQYIIKREDLGEHFMDDGGEGYDVQAWGKAYLYEIIQRSTDSITINPNSIVYATTNHVQRSIVFQRNADDLITSISDPNGLDSNGNPTGQPAVKYEYDNNDNLIYVERLVDRNAGTYVTNSFAYTNANFPHYITGIFNADGTQVARNFYDDSGKLIAVQDADGNLTRFIHNTTNNMEVVVDRLGHTNNYVYDPRGNVIAQTNALNQVTTMAYDLNNNKTNEIIYFNGPYATNSYVYNTNLNLMVASTDPLGHTNGFTYDPTYGQLLTSSDAKAGTTVNTYDNNTGNLISTTDALGHGTTNSYRGGLLVGSSDAIGAITTNYYDSSTGYLVGTATFDASSTILSSNTFACDDNGNRPTSTVWRQVGGVGQRPRPLTSMTP